MLRTNIIPDGNEEIAQEIPVVVQIIARTAQWVHPDTFRHLPVWRPEHARGRPLYKADWKTRSTNTRRSTGQTSEKIEGNIAAKDTLMAALGVATPKPANWTVCHIWGYDDPAFKSQGSVVRDPRYFTCVANMIWLPTPLKGFTDALPVIKDMLRVCAFYLYGWVCEHPNVKEKADEIREGFIPEGYPKKWPAPDRPNILPPGTAPFTQAIIDEIDKHKARLKRWLEDNDLTHFPRDEVREVLKFWNINL